MSKREEAILRAAEAWAAAHAEVAGMTGREDMDSAELAIYSVAERVEALRTAERMLYEAARPGVEQRAVMPGSQLADQLAASSVH